MRIGAAMATMTAALTLCVGLAACGEASSSHAAVNALTPTADKAEAQANAVAVSPLPGTEDASPDTQISFLGEPAPPSPT